MRSQGSESCAQQNSDDDNICISVVQGRSRVATEVVRVPDDPGGGGPGDDRIPHIAVSPRIKRSCQRDIVSVSYLHFTSIVLANCNKNDSSRRHECSRMYDDSS